MFIKARSMNRYFFVHNQGFFSDLLRIVAYLEFGDA